MRWCNKSVWVPSLSPAKDRRGVIPLTWADVDTEYISSAVAGGAPGADINHTRIEHSFIP